MYLTTIIVPILTLLLFVFYPQRYRKKTRNLPGPPGIAFFGNLFQIPPYHSWLKFKEWSDIYGPIFRLRMAGREHVVISKEKIANDLLRERGNIYSSREHLYFAGDLLSNNMRPLLLPYNDLWRRGRKLMHQLTMPAAAESYQPVQDYESKRLLLKLMTDRQDMTDGSNKRVASPGAYLVDTLPFLRHLPSIIAPFQREGKRLHNEELTLFRKLQQDVRDEMKRKDGQQTFSFTRSFLEKQELYGLSDDEGAYVIGTLFEAGSGTTAAAMMSFCLAMCHFPEWQKEMQEELDREVGDRIPDFDDIPRLPTIRAVIKEVLRWRPVTAGGVPHQLTKDDTYNGYFFTRGTVFHANQWAIHRDPELYPDPESFKPERWLSRDYPTYQEPLTRFPNLQNYSCFGFGRRICPGQNIAERSLHILTARIAWAVTLSKREGQNLPLYDYTTGFNVQPRHFDFDLSIRQPGRLDQVRTALEQADRNRL